MNVGRSAMSEQHKILVVDDAVHIRKILQFSLVKKGYKVVLAPNGHKALDIAMGPGPPDLILLDVMMPQMDGYAVIQQLKTHPDARYIPVILLSAKGQKKDIVKGLEAGADDYITKPFNFEAIHDKIRQLIKEAISSGRRRDGDPSRIDEDRPPSMSGLATASPVPRSPSPSRSQVPGRRHYAIMLTDIVGFSQGMEVDEDHAYLRLLKHNEIIRGAISKNHGDEIKTIGDAFLVRFKKAMDAVQASIEIQHRLAAYNRHKEMPDRIMVRIGIHIGDIMITEDDVFGNGVNIASRVEPLAEPGGVCITRDVYDAVRAGLKIRTIALGPRELKNIKERVEIYRICIE